MPDNFRDLRDANHHAREAGRDAQAAGQNIVNFVADIWSAGYSVARQDVHDRAEAFRGVVRGAVDVANGTGRLAQGAANEAVRENQDLFRGAGQAVDGTVRTARDFGHGAHQVIDATGHVIQQGVDATVNTATAAGNRIGDHYRDRPMTATAEGVLGPVDGLIRGGINPRDRAPAGAERTTAHPANTAHTANPAHLTTDWSAAHRTAPPAQRHDGPAAPRHDAPAARAAAPEHANHQVARGESYYSIAASQGGSRQEIVNRMNHLRQLNHDRQLLPNLEIVMS